MPDELVLTALHGSPADPWPCLTRRVDAIGGRLGPVRLLGEEPVPASDAPLTGLDLHTARAAARGWAQELALDLSVRPAGLTLERPVLVVLDVDSTLIRDEVIELLAAHVGREAEVAAVTERAMRGELDFAESLHHRVAVLEGLPVEVFDEVRAQVRVTPGAADLVARLSAHGSRVGVVSGGFLEVVQPLADSLGIHHAHANRLEVRDGRLTGRVDGPVVDRTTKAAMLRRYAEADGIALERTVAVGDGANDLEMMATAALGVAFNAKPAVRGAADTTITPRRLDAVLPLLGCAD